MEPLRAGEKFMAVGAHCDDVDLRCGGTFSRLVREGAQGCYVVAVENAYVCAHFPVKDAHEALRTRREEATRASEILGASRLEWLDFKSYYFNTLDNPFKHIFPTFESLDMLNREMKDVDFIGGPPVHIADRLPQCLDTFKRLVLDVGPRIIFTHAPDDRHPDHYAMARFVEKAVREISNDGAEIKLCFWEPGSAGPMMSFQPDLFVELSEEDIETKRRALDAYVSQDPNGEHVRRASFASHRAAAWGRLAGIPFAEAFATYSCTQKTVWEGESDVIRQIADGTPTPKVWRLQG